MIAYYIVLTKYVNPRHSLAVYSPTTDEIAIDAQVAERFYGLLKVFKE